MSRRGRVSLLCLLLGGATLAVYWPVTGHDFVTFDDPLYVTDNARVRAGVTIDGVGWALTTAHTGNWEPLTWVSLMADAERSGLDPGRFHLTNVLLHTAAALALLVAFEEMTGALWPSAFVAAVFALHPLHVESVAWVAERKDVLSALFGMLTIWAYARWARLRRPRWYLATVLAFALGLSAKSMLVTLPCVLLLLDYWPLARREAWRALLVEKTPLFALAALASVITIAAQSTYGLTPLDLVPLPLRLSNAVVSYVRYLVKAVWPSGLACFYPFPDRWPVWTVAGSGALLLVTTAVMMRGARRLPFLAVGWLWFLGMLVPVIGLIQVGLQSIADRYMYLPLVGLLILVAWGAPALLAGRDERAWPLVTGGGIVVLACMLATTRQLRHWQDSFTLFTRALAVTENNFIAHTNLAEVLLARGELDEAAAHLRTAIRLRPEFPNAYDDLGMVLARQGALDEAVGRFQTALAMDPSRAVAHYNLATVLYRMGRTEEAVAHFGEARRLDPDRAEVYNNLGVALNALGRRAEAIAMYERALQLRPDYQQARRNLAAARADEDRPAATRSSPAPAHGR